MILTDAHDIHLLKYEDLVQIGMVDGRLKVKDPMRDYILRGDALEQWNYLDFILGTYDGKKKDITSCEHRAANVRVLYRDDEHRGNRCRIIRSLGHETMPYIPGQWFPKRDETKNDFLFEAAMLAFLKPWRTVRDLKTETETFEHAFNEFVSNATRDQLFTVQNIEFYYECSKSAEEHQNLREAEDFNPNYNSSVDHENDIPVEEAANLIGDGDPVISEVSEDDIERALQNPFSGREQLYADIAIDVGLETGALDNAQSWILVDQRARPANADQLVSFREWEDALKNGPLIDDPDEFVDAVDDDSGIIQVPNSVGIGQPVEATVTAIAIRPRECVEQVPTLNTRQRMAHDIVAQHLDQYLTGQNPSPRLVIVHGPGGTGKSALLNAISQMFAHRGASSLLARTATTGVAASIIGGSTLHSWAALPVQNPRSDNWITQPGKEVEKRRKRNLGKVLWLVIDEMSMLTTPLLAHLSKVTGAVRTGIDSVDPGTPFGGISVLLSGDLHQFPPVASPKKELYCSTPPNNLCLMGRNLYEQFNIVIGLDEQVRIQDTVWNGILHRARTGDCTSDDILEIRKLVLTDTSCDVPDFTKAPWNECILVTPRNSVRMSWNTFALREHCRRTGRVCYVVTANDSIDDRPLTRGQRLTIAHMKPDETNHLPNRIELAIGMKAMVLLNLATDADLANGSRGIITDIVLHPEEECPQNDELTVHLKYPPSVILFKSYQHKTKPVPGLPEGVIPIFPTRKTFTIKEEKKRTVTRHQFALTPAYAFTDFKSQGQTIEHVIVDLAKPPSGRVTAFNAYVALSRSRGRSTIRLLRPFNEKLFTVHPSEELRKEDERLALLGQQTVQRFENGEIGNFGARDPIAERLR